MNLNGFFEGTGKRKLPYSTVRLVSAVAAARAVGMIGRLNRIATVAGSCRTGPTESVFFESADFGVKFAFLKSNSRNLDLAHGNSSRSVGIWNTSHLYARGSAVKVRLGSHKPSHNAVERLLLVGKDLHLIALC